ncbi:MAG: PAS domain-containing protein [Candidatus Wildermuthbacteria bacterium]|nr:PAS domain-containing protein [Candidatus Wildermuthbacteria bacterium]
MDTLFLIASQVIALVLTIASLFAWRSLRVKTDKEGIANEQLLLQTKQLETAKAKSEYERDQLNAILSSMGEGLLVVGKDKRIILMNQAASILLRIAPTEAVGKDARQVFDLVKEEEDDSRLDALLDDVVRQLNIVNIRVTDNYYLKSVLGRKFPVAMIVASLVREGETLGAISVFRDITKEKEIDQAKSEFVSIVSHQLRSPLGSMRWNSELLLEGEMGKLPKDASATIGEIYQSTQRMIGLVNDLLDVSRIDQGRVKNEPALVQPLDHIEAAIRETRTLAEKEGIRIELDAPSAVLSKIFIDPMRFREIMQNLLVNSIQYNKKNGITRIALKEEGGELYISVSDTGIGISKKDQGKIFSKFYRAPNAIRAYTEGSGLGLFVVKSYIEEWGGTIRFHSEEGKGTVFTVVLPLQTRAAAKPAIMREKEYGTAK